MTSGRLDLGSIARTDDPLERALLDAARGDSLEVQLGRWHRFAGAPAWLELQAIKIRGERSAFRTSRYAHADDVRTAARLAATADRWPCPGVYLIGNTICDAVPTRDAPGQWHDLDKGEGTSDAEIAARSVLFIDIDAKRPKGTSATDAEVARTAAVAREIYVELAGILEDTAPLAIGASGNGRAVLVALDHLDVAEAGRRHVAILVALASRFSDADVEIDRSVHDAKRILPCWGTSKKKGAPGLDDRPHRRTALVCSAEVTRATMTDLDRIVETLRHGLADTAQREIDRALGIKLGAPSSTTQPVATLDASSPFKRANSVAVADVLTSLGLLDGEQPTCPGCGLSDAGVAIVGNGLKCSHARCASKGVRGGFRTPVDIVSEKRGCSPKDAVTAMAAQFGFEGFPAPAEVERGTGNDTGTEPASPSTKGSRAATPSTVIAGWRDEGPLLHEPTGIAALDEATGGGPVYGSRWYIIGAPDAGKTGLLVQIADTYARRGGIIVGIHAADEEPSDIVTRLAQRAGWKRSALERRDAGDLELVADRLAELSIRLYDASHTIEEAAAELAAEAERRGMRAVLCVDSIQTVTCAGEVDARSIREAVTARAQAIRAVATRHRMIVLCTSEMSRAAYRSVQAAEESNDLAAAKESGAIEYSARVLVALRSVSGEPDLVQLRIAKNKHGPSGAEIYLRLDRSRMTLSEVDAPEPPDVSAEAIARARVRATEDAARVAVILAASPGASRRDVAAQVRARFGSMSTDRVEAALATFEAALVRVVAARGAHRLYLDGRRVPDAVLAALDAPDRAKVARATPPESESKSQPETKEEVAHA
jgi:KaiC/GvpD/RAD55 family RecA-like ATPase